MRDQYDIIIIVIIILTKKMYGTDHALLNRQYADILHIDVNFINRLELYIFQHIALYIDTSEYADMLDLFA
jgi:hypothetical protein